MRNCYWNLRLSIKWNLSIKPPLLTYLRISGRQRGLIINFNVPFLKEGIYRLVNNYRPPKQT